VAAGTHGFAKEGGRVTMNPLMVSKTHIDNLVALACFGQIDDGGSSTRDYLTRVVARSRRSQ
jgi:hypothetical protein